MSAEIIIEKEKVLLDAFQNKDLETLNKLIHDAAVFILPNGMQLTKKAVIENYRNGNTAMTVLVSSDQTINILGDTAVVSFILHLKGNSIGNIIDAKFRYIRVWKLFDGTWKAIAVSGVALAD
ncbi:MAG: hypothetical protein JWP12_872 [Bacteroidetes bacterium]|nr:hypothetical protein [Bacteroidota bacterium]